MNQEERNTDLRYIGNSDLWPHWPFLPMKRFRGQDREFGYLRAVSGERLKIRRGNMYMAKEDDPVGWEYATAEAMLDDGWVVD